MLSRDGRYNITNESVERRWLSSAHAQRTGTLGQGPWPRAFRKSSRVEQFPLLQHRLLTIPLRAGDLQTRKRRAGKCKDGAQVEVTTKVKTGKKGDGDLVGEAPDGQAFGGDVSRQVVSCSQVMGQPFIASSASRAAYIDR